MIRACKKLPLDQRNGKRGEVALYQLPEDYVNKSAEKPSPHAALLRAANANEPSALI